MRAAVLVMGDIGRSPRMQYHALSLANQANMQVDVIGFTGMEIWQKKSLFTSQVYVHFICRKFSTESECFNEVKQNPNITIHSVYNPQWQILKRSFLLRIFVKVFLQLFSLLYLLLWVLPKMDFLLVQARKISQKKTFPRTTQPTNKTYNLQMKTKRHAFLLLNFKKVLISFFPFD